MKLTKKWATILPFWLLLTLLTFWVRDHAFFWDTVQLASKQAHWYFNHNFQHFFLPQAINSGHPPFFGFYLAICWKIFGKTLIISHFSILPFLLGIVYYLYELGVYFGNEKAAKYLVLLVLVDPVFAGQSVLVSPDLVLVFAFLWSIDSILKKKYKSLAFGIILLGLVSLRGMMVGLVLYLWGLINLIFFPYKSNKYAAQTALKFIFPFLPGGILALTFLVAHYLNLGWVGYHLDSPWAGSFAKVDLAGFLKNIGILGWRLLDFGRCFLWLILGYYFLHVLRRKSFQTTQFKLLVSLIFLLVLILTPSLLVHQSLLAHRYLLPILLTITLLFYHLWVITAAKKSLKFFLFGMTFLGLITGNLWIYPKQIAQGWDATLAHLPYYELRTKMITFIDKEKIPYREIGTVFPAVGPFEWYDLNERIEGFVKKDFSENKYFFYSVVFNDISEEELAILETQWEIIQSFSANRLTTILYRKKENPIR